jgi:MarR family transcriptional regulator, organic hydroperoxide resistance regulator
MYPAARQQEAEPAARPAAGPPLGNQDPGVEAWALMVRLFLSNKPRMAAIGQEFDLAPMQMHTLLALPPGEELPMSALAEFLVCDASNVTGIVDRLEARGLIERRSARHDRRVKMLAVTPEGARVRERVGTRMAEPPAPIADLPRADQRALRDALRKALARAAP